MCRWFRFDPKDTAILQGIGAWWKVNGESIRGTERTPLSVQAWGESTRKGNTLYLHVFRWPHDGKLIVGGLKSDVTRAWLLADVRRAALKVRRLNPLDVLIEVPAAAPDAADSVVAVECQGDIAVDLARLLSTSVTMDTLRVFDGQLHGRLRFGPGKKTDAYVQNWSSPDDFISWPVRLNESAAFDVGAVYDAQPRSDGGAFGVGIGAHGLSGTVKQGAEQTASLGSVALAPGVYEVRVYPRQIKGDELMRLRRLVLTSIPGMDSQPGPSRADDLARKSADGYNESLSFNRD